MELKRPKVLVVEPSGDWRDLVTFVLIGCGYHVVNGRASDAVTEAARLHPDLILLDLAAAESAGAGMVRRLKTCPLTSAIPIITETARGEEERARKATAEGADEVLYQPYDLADLAAVLRRKLGRVEDSKNAASAH